MLKSRSGRSQPIETLEDPILSNKVLVANTVTVASFFFLLGYLEIWCQ